MARLFKVVGLASVYMMQLPCTFADHGFSIVPNGLIPNPLAGISTTLTNLLRGFTT